MAQPVVTSEPNELWKRNIVRSERVGKKRVGKKRVRKEGVRKERVRTGEPHHTGLRYK
jgi:hypothetical protein